MKKSARADNARWLEELAANGDWKTVQKFTRKKGNMQSRLKNAEGIVVSTAERSETFAAHLKHIQWRVRPSSLLPDMAPAITADLQVNSEPFTPAEMRKAVQKMRAGKAGKDMDIPNEVFRAFCCEDGDRLEWLVNFCNQCWQEKGVPEEWAISHVVLL